jgi:VWFA-related protein
MKQALLALSLSMIAVGGSLSLASGQQTGTLRATIGSIREDVFPDAHAIVNFQDSSGADLQSLTAANFSATVDGKPAVVSAASLASSQNVPLDVLLVIDASGSMQGDPIAQAKAAAKSFVAQLAPIDRVAIISFNSTVTAVQDYSIDRPATNAAIDGLKAQSTTDLYGATAAAAVKAGGSASQRRAVILLSDGAQEASGAKLTREDAINAAAGVGVPIFAVGEGKSIDRGYLNALADATHGRYLEAPKAGELTSLYAGIGKLLLGQYVVTFNASAAAGKSAVPVMIQVNAAGASTAASTDFKPSAAFIEVKVSISGVQPGEALADKRDVIATLAGLPAASRVVFYVDGVNVFETHAEPYTFSYDPAAYGTGDHTLKVSVDSGGKFVDSPSVAFSSTAPVVATPEPSDGGSLPILPMAGIAGVALLAALAFAVLNRAGGGEPKPVAVDQRITPWVGQPRSITVPVPDLVVDEELPSEDIGEPMGLLIARSGSDFGREYVIGAKPASLGSGASCALRVRDPGFSSEEARLWVRKGHLMVHRMTRLSVIASNGESGGWVILEPGDTFDVGDHTYEFRLLDQTQVVQEDTSIPDVLRDPDIPRHHAAPDMSPRLTEMMPHDLGFESDTGERAS